MQCQPEKRGQEGVVERVLNRELCTGCGACLSLCPNFAYHLDRVVRLHPCDLESGRCYAYCPRTEVDLGGLQARLLGDGEWIPELGVVKAFVMTRAADPEVRASAQHGGTASALLSLALAEEQIDAAVVASRDSRHLSEPRLVLNAQQVRESAGSKFVVSPTVAVVNAAMRTAARRIGVVATPCQALALAKMRVTPAAEDRERVDRLQLVIGLFCGWALSWRELNAVLRQSVPDREVLGLDIPPSRHQCLDVSTDRGSVEIPLRQVQPAVRPNCRYCFDLTCEFADISVGSARSPDGWAVDRGWNQTLVRSERGLELLERAREQGVLEFKPMPAGNLDRLKRAALNKKRACLENLERKSGCEGDLVYLRADDRAVVAAKTKTGMAG